MRLRLRRNADRELLELAVCCFPLEVAHKCDVAASDAVEYCTTIPDVDVAYLRRGAFDAEPCKRDEAACGGWERTEPVLQLFGKRLDDALVRRFGEAL